VLASACLAPLALTLVLHSRPGAIVRGVENGGDWYARSPGWFTTRGLYSTEHAPDGSAFAWVGGRLRFQIPRLSRTDAYELRLRVRSGRPGTEPPVEVRIVADGLDAGLVRIGAEWQELIVPLRSARLDGAVVLIDASTTFTPGPKDPRALAFMIDRVTLAPVSAASVQTSTRALVDVSVFAGAIALAAVICAFPALMALAIGFAAAGAAVWLVLFDAAFLGVYSASVATLGLATCAAAAIATLAARLASEGARQWWRVALFLVIACTALRLAVFVHPAAPVSDGMFHVHRAQSVRAGDYFFTSVTPRPFYEFPYPIGLYVAAQPFWNQVSDRVALLRSVTLVTDALVALALFAVVSARWSSPATGLLAAAFALMLPVVIQGISTANLTNVFAQSVFSLAVLWVGWWLPSPRSAVACAGAALLFSAAYLSHFSTAVIGVPASALMVGFVPLSRDPREARAWRWVAAAVAIALALSYVLYYSHFHDVYARTLSRIGGEGAQTSFVATLAEHSESKPVTVLRFLVLNYGWGALALALLGCGWVIVRTWRDGWTLVLSAVGLTVLVFLAIGALTPVEMRASLAAHPVVASFAALGVTWLWSLERRALRAVAVAGFLATLAAGIAALRAVLV
jgi:hypothetical protein